MGKEQKYYVYIIECEKWKGNFFVKRLYYTGLTDNPKRRLYEHMNGVKSNWMKNNNIKPVKFVHMELFNNPHTAHKRENNIKRMSLNNKLKLIKWKKK